MSCRSYSAHRFSISARGGVTSTSEAGKTKKNVRLREGVRWTNEDKLIELLTEREFRELFRMPCGIAICLMDGGPMSTEEESFNAIIFSKEQFNVGLRFLLPSLFKSFFHFTKIPSTFLYPNTVRILMGCSILNMLYHLNLSLLEVLFVYSIKMS